MIVFAVVIALDLTLSFLDDRGRAQRSAIDLSDEDVKAAFLHRGGERDPLSVRREARPHVDGSAVGQRPDLSRFDIEDLQFHCVPVIGRQSTQRPGATGSPASRGVFRLVIDPVSCMRSSPPLTTE